MRIEEIHNLLMEGQGNEFVAAADEYGQYDFFPSYSNWLKGEFSCDMTKAFNLLQHAINVYHHIKYR